MKHDDIVKRLVAAAEHDPNQLGFLLFGSVAAGTHRENSDIDTITVLRTSQPASGITNAPIDGIKVGNIYLTYAILIDSVETVPYLLHPLGQARLLVDREGSIQPLLEKIRAYFAAHPEIAAEWNGYYAQLKKEKAQFGYEKTSIVDVWNELEKRYSGGRTRRRFFNSFYMTSPLIFSVVKKLLSPAA